MHRRGIRVLPGGDYGFAWTPHGKNAQDLEYLRQVRSASRRWRRSSRRRRYGGQIMMQGDELGQIKEGYLADLLLVDGDPLANLVDPAGPEAAPRDHEGRQVPQGAARSRVPQRAHGACAAASSGRRRGSTDRRSGWRADRRGRLVVRLASAAGRIVDNARLFVTTLLNGVTLAALYFLVASGFTLVFGLMRNVNLAHGSLYLLGAYVGWMVGERDRLVAARRRRRLRSPPRSSALLLQVSCSAAWRAQDLRQTLVTIGISIVLADLMLWIWGGEIYQLRPAARWIYGSTAAAAGRASIPTYRIVVLLASRSSSASACGCCSTARASA